VNNPSPSTTVVLPSNGATLSGSQYFDATASPGVAKVQYELSGGSLSDSVIATATPTIYGWLAAWNTTTVPNGSYTLQSVASYAGGVSGTSAGVAITVTN
jgi:Bacterial Ig domain